MTDPLAATVRALLQKWSAENESKRQSASDDPWDDGVIWARERCIDQLEAALEPAVSAPAPRSASVVRVTGPAPTSGTAGQLLDYVDGHSNAIPAELRELCQRAVGELRCYEVDQYELVTRPLVSAPLVTQRRNNMVKKRFAWPIVETRAGNVTAILEIVAVNDDAASALRDEMTETLDRASRLLASLRHLTASEVFVEAPDAHER